MFQLFRVKQLKSVPRTGSYYCTKKDAGNDGGASQAEFLNVLKKMMSTKPNTTPVTDSSKPSSGPAFAKLFDSVDKEPAKQKSSPIDSEPSIADSLLKGSSPIAPQGPAKNEESILNFLNDVANKTSSEGMSFVSPFERSESKRWKPVSQLEYFPVYPKQIKKWVTFTRTPRGFYDLNGRWVVLGEFDIPTGSLERYEAESSRMKMQKIFEEEQAKLPEHLRGRFRFGVQYEEIKDLGPKVKRLFSFSSATQKEIRKEEKRQAIIKWRKHENDTASDAIQVHILTQRIEALITHLQNNKQDKRNLRNLQLLVKRRRGLMRYLKKRDVHLYFCVLREAKLKDLYNVYNYNVK